ncbi:MAG: RNA polymerase sigma factor [Oscillospiraceae bacterium]|nr:RNA polymerase sigma factor [Oscillospiraceae bacterium]
MESNATQGLAGEELYHRFANGDNKAFEELVLLYEDELSRFIYGTVRDHHETEHLTIETFAQLALNRKKYEGKSSFKTYLFSIGKNLTMRHIKKRGREQHLSFEDATAIPIDDDQTLYGALEREETRQYLQKAMQELKKEYHAVLVLLYFEDMSYKQAAQVMNKSDTQIKHLAYRAKAALKKNLESKGYIRLI